MVRERGNGREIVKRQRGDLYRGRYRAGQNYYRNIPYT